MGRDDWYRNTTWNDDIRDDFFARLNRSRLQRDQYLVIQALTLAESHPDVTLELVQLYFDTRRDTFHDVRAFDAKAKAHLRLRETKPALAAYREVLDLERRFPQMKTNAFVEYPFIVAIEGVRSEYEESVRVLNERAEDLAFPVQHFMWHAAYALILSDTSRQDARDHAQMAIKVAKEKKSGFRWHQNLGVVGLDHVKTLELLRAIDT